MPRRMFFGPSRATSIDLCVRDLVRASRFANSTRIIAEQVDHPFDGFAMTYFPASGRSRTYSRANFIAQLARAEQPDVIVVQAHLPTAAAIAWRCPDVKVVLHTHNFQKSSYDRRTINGVVHRALKRARYRRLAGLIHVSEACAKDFADAWPDVAIPQAVIYNSFDFSEWQPAEIREPEILCVGRSIATKGILDAAEAVARVLPAHPGWRARFILSTVQVEPEYFAAVQRALAPLGARAKIEVQQPFAVVKQAYEQAAIALVPSRWVEPFGRTALEAHAGGAALICSGTGGLREASGECAVFLPEVSAAAIGTAIERLIEAPEQRTHLAKIGATWARERFSTEHQAARMDEFLSGVVAGVWRAGR